MTTPQQTKTPFKENIPLKTINRPGNDLDATLDAPRKRILIIDDDPDSVDMTKYILCEAGFDVASAYSGIVALRKCVEVNPDLILLDLMMPELDGFDTFQRLKKITRAPVIVVTGSGDRNNAVKSLQAGMEDYIAKPFHSPELVARVQAVLRRSQAGIREDILVFPKINLMISLDTQEVNLRGKKIRVLPREFTVLTMLAEKAPKPVRYEFITQRLWGADSARNRSHLKNIIFSLRNKLEDDPGNPKMLINYHRFGYQLDTQENEFSLQ